MFKTLQWSSIKDFILVLFNEDFNSPVQLGGEYGFINNTCKIIPMVEDHEGLIFTIGIRFQFKDYTMRSLLSSLYITITFMILSYDTMVILMGTILRYIT